VSAGKTATATPWQIYRRLIRFSRPYSGLLLLALVAALIEAGASSAFLFMMKPITDETFINKNTEIAAWLPAAII